jgi:excisionase family DNA binding protein
MDDTVLTPEQVAQILQMHPFTVLKFIKQGRLKASKLGRVYRIRRSDVDFFLNEQAGESEAAMLRRQDKAQNQEKKKKAEPQAKKAAGAMDAVNKVEKSSKKPHKNPTRPEPTFEEEKVTGKLERITENDIDHYIIELKHQT